MNNQTITHIPAIDDILSTELLAPNGERMAPSIAINATGDAQRLFMSYVVSHLTQLDCDIFYFDVKY